MVSRVGLVVWVAVVFVGVGLVGATRWSIMNTMCAEIQAMTDATKAATHESIDERMGGLAILGFLQKKHCS